MRLAAVLIGLHLTLAAAGVAAEVTWQNDWNAAFATAREANKLVLVDYYATWCKPCRLMEATTLRDGEVAKRLADFVLLRLNVDRTDKDREKRVGGFPSYIVYDSAEREWFRILGYYRPEPFLVQLDAIQTTRPKIFEASRLLDQGRDTEAWFVIAHAYNDVRSEHNARLAFTRAKSAALSSGDSAAAERAEIQFAFTWALQGEPRRSARALEAIKTASRTSENEALRWLLLGRCHELAHDLSRAQESYRQVMSVVGQDHFLYAEARTAIARVK